MREKGNFIVGSEKDYDVFDEFKMGEIFKKAIQSAYNKAKELSQ